MTSQLRDVHAGAPPTFPGHALDSVVTENQQAVRAVRESLLETNPDVIVGIERGGAFLGEVVTHGSEDLGDRVRSIPTHRSTGGKFKFDQAAMQAEFRRLIEGGARKIALVDAYMGGRDDGVHEAASRALGRRAAG